MLIAFAKFAAAMSSRIRPATALEPNVQSAANSQTTPQTRLPTFIFESVSTPATLRNGMVFVFDPNGIRPNNVFGFLYWMRVVDAAMLVFS